MDMHIIGCLIEWCNGLLDTYGLAGSNISGCCIEGFPSGSVPIIIRDTAIGVSINGNYFESNGSGVNIDISGATAKCQLAITDNSFSEYHNQDAGIIHLPPYISSGFATIAGNSVAVHETLLHVPDDATDLRRAVWAYANSGKVRDPNGALRATVPYDLIHAIDKANEEFELSDTDKAAIVDDTLAALSGEEWEFTMSDGSVVKRTVATAHLTNFDQETWSFVLTDGTTIEKAVAIA
jgi:hypothetical protein